VSLGPRAAGSASPYAERQRLGRNEIQYAEPATWDQPSGRRRLVEPRRHGPPGRRGQPIRRPATSAGRTSHRARGVQLAITQGSSLRHPTRFNAWDREPSLRRRNPRDPPPTWGLAAETFLSHARESCGYEEWARATVSSTWPRPRSTARYLVAARSGRMVPARQLRDIARPRTAYGRARYPSTSPSTSRIFRSRGAGCSPRSLGRAGHDLSGAVA
jgi:hypothetical protein